SYRLIEAADDFTGCLRWATNICGCTDFSYGRCSRESRREASLVLIAALRDEAW
ncbi:MAG: hypothetical protein QOJ04_1121, partial [Caballeronia sp.]|nr:hypothetical protein [Caballeronia sp.]